MILQILRVTTKVFTALIVLAGLAAIVVSIIFGVQGARFVTVLTPSMTASGMPVGTGIIATPIAGNQIKAGDFIYAQSPFGDSVMHEAMGAPVKDANNRLQLTMKGSSNPAADSYEYDVTDGAFEVAWSMPGLGARMLSLWAPLPGTEGLVIPLPGGGSFQGIPLIVLAIFVLLVWILWPSRGTPKSSSPSGESKVSPSTRPVKSSLSGNRSLVAKEHSKASS